MSEATCEAIHISLIAVCTGVVTGIVNAKLILALRMKNRRVLAHKIIHWLLAWEAREIVREKAVDETMEKKKRCPY